VLKYITIFTSSPPIKKGGAGNSETGVDMSLCYVSSESYILVHRLLHKLKWCDGCFPRPLLKGIVQRKLTRVKIRLK
jgi:hypothetical protein